MSRLRLLLLVGIFVVAAVAFNCSTTGLSAEPGSASGQTQVRR